MSGSFMEHPILWATDEMGGTNIPPNARLVGCFLAGWYAGLEGCRPMEHPSLAKIAAWVGMTERTVAKHLKTLDDAGFLQRLEEVRA